MTSGEEHVMDVPRVYLDVRCVDRVIRATNRDLFWVSRVGWVCLCCCCCDMGKTLLLCVFFFAAAAVLCLLLFANFSSILIIYETSEVYHGCQVAMYVASKTSWCLSKILMCKMKILGAKI
jgi:hypothetical protein